MIFSILKTNKFELIFFVKQIKDIFVSYVYKLKFKIKVSATN